MTGERLGNLGILALHGFDIQVNICELFKSKHPRRMCNPSFYMICPKYRYSATSPVNIVALLVSFLAVLF